MNTEYIAVHLMNLVRSWGGFLTVDSDFIGNQGSDNNRNDIGVKQTLLERPEQ